MAEILIKAVDASHPDPEKDRRGCYKRGMPVCVMPDGHVWGASEGLPGFVVLKVPGVSVDRVQQFLATQDEDATDDEGNPVRRVYRRRLWRLRWADLPAAARTRLAATGSLTIGPAGTGADYTWAQVRMYLNRYDTEEAAPASL